MCSSDLTSRSQVRDWHAAERHQYIVTLRGRGEIELVGGRKIALEPGSNFLRPPPDGVRDDCVQAACGD